MMPPKKSKAARKAGENDVSVVPDSKVENGTEPEDVAEDTEEVNIFKVEVLDNKRQRNLPAGEQMMKSWLGDNFQQQEGQELVIQDMYDEYLASCISSGSYAVDLHTFMKGVKELFPNGITVRPASPHVSAIRVRKPKKERTPKQKSQADTFKIKMNDIITRALREFGGAKKKPLRFNTIKLFITSKFPALRIELRPNFLLRALTREVYAGNVELVRGIGKAGFYRLPLTEEEVAAEAEEAKKKPKAKENAEQKESKGDGEEADTEEEGEKRSEDDLQVKVEEDGEEEEEPKAKKGSSKPDAKGKKKKKTQKKTQKKKSAPRKKKKVPTATLR